MGVQIVFSDVLDPATANLSVEFSNATAFLIEAPGLTAELEIDVYLQIYLTGINGQLVRNIPLGKVEEQAILLNITDTDTATAIPSEYLNSGLEMKLLFLASEATFLYAYIIKPDCTLCSIDNRLNDLETKLDLVLAALNVPQPVAAVATTDDVFVLQFLGII